MTERTDYQATYRRSERALPLLLGIVAILIGGIFAVIRYVDGRYLETTILSLTGFVVFSMLMILVTTFRVHRWTVGPDGIHIHERPKVPLTSFSRRAVVAFPAIAALRRVESGFDYLIEIVTRDGRRYRMPQALITKGRRIGFPDPDANLDAFAASIRTAAERAGHKLPATSDGLSFWNSITGLFFLLIIFAISLAIAGAVAFALWDGFMTTRSRQGEMAAILLVLPIGAGYLLWKSVKRRRAVLAMSQSR